MDFKPRYPCVLPKAIGSTEQPRGPLTIGVSGEIGKALPHRTGADVLEGLRELEQHDLVFEESDMFMNLVMPGATVAPARGIEAVLC